MLMTKWSDSKGLVRFEEGLFSFNIEIELSHKTIIYQWLHEICQYLLHRYFAKKVDRFN